MARFLLGTLALLTLPVAAFDLQLVQGEQRWHFSLEELVGIESLDVVTETPWTEGEHRFTGVTLQTLLETVGSETEAKTLRLVALNDYAVETDVQFLLESDALIAYKRDGEPMPVRDYGPYWVLFPFSDRPELANRDIRNVSVWQLKTIEIRH